MHFEFALLAILNPDSFGNTRNSVYAWSTMAGLGELYSHSCSCWFFFVIAKKKDLGVHRSNHSCQILSDPLQVFKDLPVPPCSGQLCVQSNEMCEIILVNFFAIVTNIPELWKRGV